jgi:hypothetical protein
MLYDLFCTHRCAIGVDALVKVLSIAGIVLLSVEVPKLLTAAIIVNCCCAIVVIANAISLSLISVPSQALLYKCMATTHNANKKGMTAKYYCLL